jgi:DNA-binding response OmpR family regulator
MRLLLVTSDAAFGAVSRTGLDRRGYRCSVVEPTAVQADAARAYGAVIVDCDDWPGATSFLEALQRVAPGTAAFAVTSAADPGLAVALLRGGDAALALDYIEKPDNSFLERVDRMLNDHFRFIQRNGFRVDLDQRQAYYDDQPVLMQEREMDLFITFMRWPGRDMLYTELAREVLGKAMPFDEAYSTLRSPMYRLRKALRAAAGRDVLTRHDPERGIRFVPVGRLYRPRSRD